MKLILFVLMTIFGVLSSSLHTPIFEKYWNGSNTEYGLFYVIDTAGYKFGGDCSTTTDLDYYNHLIRYVQCGNNTHCSNHTFTCGSSSILDCYGVDHIIEYEFHMRTICENYLCGSRINANRIMAWKEWIEQRKQLDKYSSFNEIQIVYGHEFIRGVVGCIERCNNHFSDSKKRAVYIPPETCNCCYPQSKCVTNQNNRDILLVIIAILFLVSMLVCFPIYIYHKN